MTRILDSKNFSNTSPSWSVRAWVKAGMLGVAVDHGPGHEQSPTAARSTTGRAVDARPIGERVINQSTSVMTGSKTMPEPSFAAQLAEDLSQDDLRHVLVVFGDDVTRLTGVLRDTATAGDAIGFRRAAHGLAGAAGAVGATPLERQCRLAMASPGVDAQAEGADGDPVILGRALAAIETLAQGTLQELARFVAGLDTHA